MGTRCRSGGSEARPRGLVEGPMRAGEGGNFEVNGDAPVPHANREHGQIAFVLFPDHHAGEALGVAARFIVQQSTLAQRHVAKIAGLPRSIIKRAQGWGNVWRNQSMYEPSERCKTPNTTAQRAPGP